MGKYLKKHFSLISFLFIPLVYLWDPNWLALFGVQPYWPLFWLLPWSMLYGSIDGFFLGLFLGLILDSLSAGSSFTQIPALALCGIWFGKLSFSRNNLIVHFRFGLISAMASFLCSALNFSQILSRNLSENNIVWYFPSIKNIFAQIFITGLFAPLFCSLLLGLFQRSKARYQLISLKNK